MIVQSFESIIVQSLELLSIYKVIINITQMHISVTIFHVWTPQDFI